MRRPLKTAIIGAAGVLGARLFEAYRQHYPDTVGTDWQGRQGLYRLDLANADIRPLRLTESGHTWAVIAAGVRDFTRCEREKAYTWQCNVTGTLTLASRLSEAGLKVVFFSSDAVFSGETGDHSDDAPSSPVNEYGRQKQEVERLLPERTGGRCLILRIGRLMGVLKGDGTLPDEIARQLSSGVKVNAARDQIFTPTPVNDMPWVLEALQAVDAEGVFNVAVPEAWSRVVIARYLTAGLGVDDGLVREISLDDIADGVPRPKNVSLRCERLQRTLSLSLTSLCTCLDQVIRNYRGAS